MKQSSRLSWNVGQLTQRLSFLVSFLKFANTWIVSCNISLFIRSQIYGMGRWKREREWVHVRESSNLLIHSLSATANPGPCWSREVGAFVSHLHGWHGPRHMGHLRLHFSGKLIGSLTESGSTGTQTSIHMGCHCHSLWLNMLYHIASTQMVF